MRTLKRWILGLLLTGLVAVGIGCANQSDTDNLSERPWNAPHQWETGLPGGM